DIVSEYAKGGRKNDGLAVFAEQQTAGRGRRANKWLSQPAKSILCSILLCDNGLSGHMITIASAVAAAETIGRCGRSEAKIKWPNDILLNDRKVAGILTEAVTHAKQKFYILGIGINCHQSQNDFSGELTSIATSIDIQSKSICDRNSIAKRLLVNLDGCLAAALNNPDEIVEKWNDRSMLLSKHITIEHNGRKFTGNCIGLEPAKGLIVQLARGGVKIFEATSTTIV
ncbi:MAG: biotin--[acetyl-CoA-carboxylase] ligase, partial [Phycisphaerae bacterium]|nr:biotin--[acetyl-CoA-carboxylase] ligase [Phycisphaerae bacterium]